MNVAEILNAKGNKVITVRPDMSIAAVAARLKIERVGALVVSTSEQTVDGIISERDVAYGLAGHGADLLNMTAADLMTRNVVTCTPQDTLAHISRMMTHRRIRHLPVVDGRKLVGIVSIGDVVRHRMDELEMEANVLRDYAVVRQ